MLGSDGFVAEVLEARDREVSSFLTERHEFECQKAQRASKFAEMMSQHQKESKLARSGLATSLDMSLREVICTYLPDWQLKNYCVAIAGCFAMFMLGKVKVASPKWISFLRFVSYGRWWIAIVLLYLLEKRRTHGLASNLVRGAMDKADFSKFHSMKDFGGCHCDLQKAHAKMCEMASLLDSSLKKTSYPDLLVRAVRAEEKLKVMMEFNQTLKNQQTILQRNVQGLQESLSTVGEGLQEVARRPAAINNYDQRSWHDNRSYDNRSFTDQKQLTVADSRQLHLGLKAVRTS
mmetsp:Transcript_7647/g.18307  ORF Transcript_7647/g.18307 Transcript_7647/m.18307 type:complete len:291 (+) Transcript_7647:68-940(+)